LSWKHIDHPGEVVTVGDEVTVEVLDVDMDRERVSLSLKATQEDPWQHFARTHVIGQIVPGKVTKLVPFGAFVRVEDGIEGLVHISELAVRHVDLPEQVVSVDETIYVKVIDIDLERRRISLSLKQANEGVDPEAEECLDPALYGLPQEYDEDGHYKDHAGFDPETNEWGEGDDPEAEEFLDPALYGMPQEYDEDGNYKYPEGFDPETNEWVEGYEAQREAWEQQYAAAQERWEEHKKQVAKAIAADAEASAADAVGSADAAPATGSFSSEEAGDEGTLASDEALAALREKLAGS